ncbi:hypothetical protein [Geotalea toluenoxydans]|uniref:hypothetical protein n=1 Tax=Geotalea toluenoxydans TaxID=421624 RepID=UPI001FB2766F|nr:hypothetical protein [Geotalea toluenoxydans]
MMGYKGQAGNGETEKMNLVLIGYRGTGKSLVSKLLAERLHMSLFSTDEEVVRMVACPFPR